MLNSKLLSFSSKTKSSPSAPLLAPCDTQEQLKHLSAIQQEWLSGHDTAYVIKSLQQLHKDPIDASSGSSGFLPPEGIEKSLREDIATEELVDYTNHLLPKELIDAATLYFQEHNIIPSKATIGADPYDDKTKHDFYAMHGHGTTELFSFILKALVKNKEDVIILSTPTYGLFIEPITHLANVATMTMTKNDDYKPNAEQLEQLEQLIESTNLTLKVNYLSLISVTSDLLSIALPNNRTSKNAQDNLTKKLLMLQQAIKANMKSAQFSLIDPLTNEYNDNLMHSLPKILQGPLLNIWQDKLRLPLCPRVRSYFHVNPHMPMGSVMSQEETEKLALVIAPYSDITVIDDLTYHDLVLPPCKVQPGTFAKTTTMQQRCISLYGLSKQYGLAALRSAIAIGPKLIIKSLAHDVFTHVNMPSIYSQKALHFIFKMTRVDKEKYLTETLNEYAFRRDLAIALVSGIHKIIDKKNKDKIIKILTETLPVDSQKSLLQGIPGISIAHIPESGFFLLLDFSAFKDKYIGNMKLQTSMDMHKCICYLTDVNMVPGELNLDFYSPVLRFSFCIPPTDIIEALIRIKNVLGYCKDEKIDLTTKQLHLKKPKIKAEAKKPLNLSGENTTSKLTPAFDKKTTPLYMPATAPTHQHGTRLKKVFDKKSNSRNVF